MLRQVGISSLLIVCGLVTAPAQAGIYSTFDADEEVKQYSRDYRNVFKRLLDTLKCIPNDATESHPPIRKRYLILEQLGQAGAGKLKTLEDKLNYSAVLIRRGKAYEATQYLMPITREHLDNFIVWSQYATAHFLSNNADFRTKSADLMKQALELWPKNEDDVKADLKPFLQNLGLVSTEYNRYRDFDIHLERLIRNRLREERMHQQKKPVEEMVDPIFLEAEGDRKPVRYVNSKGEFEPGKIAEDERKKLPGDAIEIVEQLLLWMPYDQRLLWQLAELFNASAMDLKKDDQRNRAIRDAYSIFTEIDPPLNRTRFALKDIQARKERLGKYVEGLKPEQELGIQKLGNLFDDDPDAAARREWWRTLTVGGVTGFAVGLFALWQLQEFRRRRQAW
ncbi:MAG: hypothetical protein EXS16_12300 [Gemmataceae bacterium]|nr:hypothetical protein [Gemmataceae bacterium]